ncbi:11813_t:CDS:2, partial [Funneliformis caledonium]
PSYLGKSKIPEIRLNCLVVSSNCPIKKITRHHVITINIDNRESIHSLRKQIKEEHSPQFDDIPITEFVIHAIDLNSDKKEASINAKSVMNNIQNKSNIGSEKFLISNIFEHFPASTSTTVARNETVSLVNDIKKYDTTKLIDFLHREKDLELSEKAFEILKTQKVNGCVFLKTSKEEFQGLGLGFRPAKSYGLH